MESTREREIERATATDSDVSKTRKILPDFWSTAPAQLRPALPSPSTRPFPHQPSLFHTPLSHHVSKSAGGLGTAADDAAAAQVWLPWRVSVGRARRHGSGSHRVGRSWSLGFVKFSLQRYDCLNCLIDKTPNGLSSGWWSPRHQVLPTKWCEEGNLQRRYASTIPSP